MTGSVDVFAPGSLVEARTPDRPYVYVPGRVLSCLHGFASIQLGDCSEVTSDNAATTASVWLPIPGDAQQEDLLLAEQGPAAIIWSHSQQDEKEPWWNRLIELRPPRSRAGQALDPDALAQLPVGLPVEVQLEEGVHKAVVSLVDSSLGLTTLAGLEVPLDDYLRVYTGPLNWDPVTREWMQTGSLLQELQEGEEVEQGCGLPADAAEGSTLWLEVEAGSGDYYQAEVLYTADDFVELHITRGAGPGVADCVQSLYVDSSRIWRGPRDQLQQVGPWLWRRQDQQQQQQQQQQPDIKAEPAEEAGQQSGSSGLTAGAAGMAAQDAVGTAAGLAAQAAAGFAAQPPLSSAADLGAQAAADAAAGGAAGSAKRRLIQPLNSHPPQHHQQPQPVTKRPRKSDPVRPPGTMVIPEYFTPQQAQWVTDRGVDRCFLADPAPGAVVPPGWVTVRLMRFSGSVQSDRYYLPPDGGAALRSATDLAVYCRTVAAGGEAAQGTAAAAVRVWKLRHRTDAGLAVPPAVPAAGGGAGPLLHSSSSEPVPTQHQQQLRRHQCIVLQPAGEDPYGPIISQQSLEAPQTSATTPSTYLEYADTDAAAAEARSPSTYPKYADTDADDTEAAGPSTSPDDAAAAAATAGIVARGVRGGASTSAAAAAAGAEAGATGSQSDEDWLQQHQGQQQKQSRRNPPLPVPATEIPTHFTPAQVARVQKPSWVGRWFMREAPAWLPEGWVAVGKYDGEPMAPGVHRHNKYLSPDGWGGSGQADVENRVKKMQQQGAYLPQLPRRSQQAGLAAAGAAAGVTGAPGGAPAGAAAGVATAAAIASPAGANASPAAGGVVGTRAGLHAAGADAGSQQPSRAMDVEGPAAGGEAEATPACEHLQDAGADGAAGGSAGSARSGALVGPAAGAAAEAAAGGGVEAEAVAAAGTSVPPAAGSTSSAAAGVEQLADPAGLGGNFKAMVDEVLRVSKSWLLDDDLRTALCLYLMKTSRQPEMKDTFVGVQYQLLYELQQLGVEVLVTALRDMVG